uniref:thrombopoietin receptor isoform X2 n=1 Tax=Myxine glutinosa TaxID=7769 RepID=UPI00358E5CCD
MERGQNTQMTSRLCTLQGVPTALGAVLLLFVTAVFPDTGLGRFIDLTCYSEKHYSLQCVWQVREHTASPSHFTLFYNSSLHQCHSCKGTKRDFTPSAGANFYCDFPAEHVMYFVPITVTLVMTTPSCSGADAAQSEKDSPNLQDSIHQPDNHVEPCDLSAHIEKELQHDALASHDQTTLPDELHNYYDHQRQSPTNQSPLLSGKVLHNLIPELKGPITTLHTSTTLEASTNCSLTMQMLHRLTLHVERHMRVQKPRRLQVQQIGGMQQVAMQGMLWVSWQEPDTGGLGSKLEYRLHFGPVNATSHTELVMKETKVNLTDLRPARPYWFRVSARPDGRSFSGPWSPWSPDSIATPPLVTGDLDLECFTSDILHLKCHWEVNASLPTITFTVKYSTRSSQGLCRDILMFHDTKRLEYTCQFSVLESENNDSQNMYLTVKEKTWVEVVLHGESVAGQHTVTLSPFILQYAVMPHAPQDVLVTGAHHGELKVLWNPPSELLAPHLQYQLRHRREKQTWQLLSVTHGRSRILYGLVPGVKYQVSVRALAASLALKGTWGSWSEEVTGQVSMGLTISMWVYYALGTFTALVLICFCFCKIQARLKIWLWRPLPSLHQAFPGQSGVEEDVQIFLAFLYFHESDLHSGTEQLWLTISK